MKIDWRAVAAQLLVIGGAVTIYTVITIALTGWWPRVGLWVSGLILLVTLLFLGTLWLPRPPPSPPAAESVPETAVALIQRYGLDEWLTDDDDPQLWAAVLQAHFPLPDDDTIAVRGLQFALGEFAPHTRLQMQPLVATHFTRLDAQHLQPESYTADTITDADIDEALRPIVPLLLLHLNQWAEGGKRPPLWSIVLPRPTIDQQIVPVYTGIVRRNRNGYGETVYWERQPDGRWARSQERLNWWMDVA